MIRYALYGEPVGLNGDNGKPIWPVLCPLCGAETLHQTIFMKKPYAWMPDHVREDEPGNPIPRYRLKSDVRRRRPKRYVKKLEDGRYVREVMTFRVGVPPDSTEQGILKRGGRYRPFEDNDHAVFDCYCPGCHARLRVDISRNPSATMLLSQIHTSRSG